MVQVVASPAQRTFPLLLPHDVGSAFLEFLELRPRHGVLSFLFEGVSHCAGEVGFMLEYIQRRT